MQTGYKMQAGGKLGGNFQSLSRTTLFLSHLLLRRQLKETIVALYTELYEIEHNKDISERTGSQFEIDYFCLP